MLLTDWHDTVWKPTMGGFKGKKKANRATTDLPETLSSELGLELDEASLQRQAKRAELSRKQKRQADRQAKKDRKQQRGRGTPAPASEQPAAKPSKPDVPKRPANPPQPRFDAASASRGLSEEKKKKKKAPPREPTAFEELLIERGLIKAPDGYEGADAMDEHIADLERKLGLHKGSKTKAKVTQLCSDDE